MVVEGRATFASELRRLRDGRGWSLADLAGRVYYSRSYLGKIETEDKPPTLDLARACDTALDADGRLLSLVTVAHVAQVAQLPPAPGTFVGRGDVFDRLGAVLSSDGPAGVPRIVAVDGPPGIGKTALALRLAHQVKDAFPDGQLHVNLLGYTAAASPTPPSEALEDFLLSLGLTAERVPDTVHQRAATYRTLIDRRRVLVVLDNAKDFEQIAPLLPASATCGVIVTSRNRLPELDIAQDHRATLAPLGNDEARTLIRAVIGEGRADAEPDALARLAERCGHLPLALRVAADLVAMYPQQAVADLVGDLDDESTRLDVLGGSAARSVRSVLSWSYRGLQPEQAALFRALGLYPAAQFSAEAAAALVDQPLPVTRRLLDALVTAHLIEPVAGGRYQMHDLLRVYAAELCAQDSGEHRQAAQERLVEWYWHATYTVLTSLAPQRPNPEVPALRWALALPEVADRDAALRWCERELPNLLPITGLAVRLHLWEPGWKVPVTWWNYLHLRKRWSAWTASHQLAVDNARRGHDEAGEAWALNNLAVAYREIGRHDEARELLDRAVALRRRTGDEVGEAWSLTALGFVAADLGEFDTAVRHHRDALLIRETIAATASDPGTVIGNAQGRCIALASLGAALIELGSLDEALQRLHEALAIAEEIGERHSAGHALTRLTDAYRRLGRTGPALDTGTAALQLARDVGDRWSEGEVLELLGRLHLDRGHPDEAMRAWQAAEEVYDEIGSPRARDVRVLLAELEPDDSAL